MTVVFVPIDDIEPTGSSVIVSGCGDFTGKIEPAPELALAEMAGPGTAGRLLECTVGNRGLYVRAEVTSGAATTKVVENLYVGIAVQLTPDSHGNAIVRRAALVDAPDGSGASSLEKRSAVAKPWQCLNIGKDGFTVAITKSVAAPAKVKVEKLQSQIDLENSFRDLAIGPGNTAANERAVILIRVNREMQREKAANAVVSGKKVTGDRAFCEWLSARAGR
jgi:hypothetical protein